MLAVINLFVYILKNPKLTTVQSDLAHLDLTAGHFAKIHFLTSSHVSFTFPREIAGLANKAVRRDSFQSTVYTPETHPIGIFPGVRIPPIYIFLCRKLTTLYRLGLSLRYECQF